MTGKKRYERAIGSLAERKESKSLVFSGALGVTTGGENLVEVNGRPGFVWVRLRNQLNELIQAFNESVSPVFDLPVLVEYDKHSPTRYRVISRDVGRYTVWGAGTSDTSSYLPRHGSQHSFDKLTSVGGGDVVWVYSDQFIPWLVTPSGSAGSLSVSVQPSAYYYNDQFRWAGGTGIAGLDVLRPTGSSNARMILVYLDPDTGNPYLATGTLTEFANTITGTQQIMPYMPSLIERTDIPLAGIRLITGTSKILWQNLYDLRDYFAHASVSGTSGGGGAPTDAEYVVMSLNGTLTDERVLTAGADIDIADGGAGGNATVSVETGTFSRAGHSHLFPYSVAIYDDHVFQATGTILDFTGNINVAVTGTSVFISSTAAGGGGATLLIYDDGAFKVTGTALDFENDLKIDVTGSTAYVNIPTGTFSRPGHTHTNELPIFDSSIFKATGTLISFDDNLTVHVTGTTIFIEGQAGASGDNTILIYDGSAFKVTGSAISFDDNLTVHVTGSTAYVVGQAGGAGGFPIIYDDSVFKNTGVAVSFDEDIEVASTGTTSYVGIPTGTFSRAGHGHLYPYSVAIYDDHVFQATGTILDFTGNINVAVTGTSVFISSVGGGEGNTLLIYDGGAFQVTGTALSFDDELDVAVTGSVAYVNVATGTFSQPGHTHYSAEVTDLQHAIPVYEDDVFQITGTIFDFGENVNVAVTGSVVFISTVDTQGGGGEDLLIYDDSAFKVTGTALSFDNDLVVNVTGSVAFINSNPTLMTIFTIEGDLVVESNPLRIYNNYEGNKTISEVFLSVNTPSTDASIIVDINKDGTTIFTTQSNRPNIAAGANTGNTTTINVPTWSDGEYLNMDVDQIGSGTAGSDLTVHIIYS